MEELHKIIPKLKYQTIPPALFIYDIGIVELKRTRVAWRSISTKGEGAFDSSTQSSHEHDVLLGRTAEPKC